MRVLLVLLLSVHGSTAVRLKTKVKQTLTEITDGRGAKVDKVKFVATATLGNDGVLEEATKNRKEEMDEKDNRWTRRNKIANAESKSYMKTMMSKQAERSKETTDRRKGAKSDSLKRVDTVTGRNHGVLKEAIENREEENEATGNRVEESDEKEYRRESRNKVANQVFKSYIKTTKFSHSERGGIRSTKQAAPCGSSEPPTMNGWTPEKVWAYDSGILTVKSWSGYLTQVELQQELQALINFQQMRTVSLVYNPYGSPKTSLIQTSIKVSDALDMLQTASQTPEAPQVSREKCVPVATILQLLVLDIARSVAPPETIMKNLLSDVNEGSAIEGMARQIRETHYSLDIYWADCKKSFPELYLYMIGGLAEGYPSREEYQRTVGALFAVYWFFQWNTGGKEQFSFGVRSDLNQPQQTRQDFFALNLDIPDLLDKAGLDGSSPGRIQAMLALTAMHDVMKMDRLKPFVSKTPWKNYDVNALITNHDDAMAYTLENFPALLPSFRDLETPEGKNAIMFSQCGFNFGWFLQAEAPPAKIFGDLKALALRLDKEMFVKNMYFLFVHFLTDLAGGSGTPYDGGGVFVFKPDMMPQFINGFNLALTLQGKAQSESSSALTESSSALTADMELYWTYLEQRWPEFSTGPANDVVRMRLVVMAESQAILEVYDRFPGDQKGLLQNELAMTGHELKEHVYPKPALDGAYQTGGPALLLYYAPALLKDPLKKEKVPPGQEPEFYFATLQILYKVYIEARKHWPVQDALAGTTVEIKTDDLKIYVNKKETTLEDIVNLARTGVISVEKIWNHCGYVKFGSTSATPA